MPALQVRDLPEDTYERLVRCASEEHRSLAQQTIAILESYLSKRESEHSTEFNPAAFQSIGTGEHGTRDSSSSATDYASHAFTPFKANGITYLVRPDETQEQRSARKKKLFASIAEKAEAGTYTGLPPAGDIVQQVRTDRLAQLGPKTGDAAW